jgi:hypothetical protein
MVKIQAKYTDWATPAFLVFYTGADTCSYK